MDAAEAAVRHDEHVAPARASATMAEMSVSTSSAQRTRAAERGEDGRCVPAEIRGVYIHAVRFGKASWQRVLHDAAAFIVLDLGSSTASIRAWPTRCRSPATVVSNRGRMGVRSRRTRLPRRRGRAPACAFALREA